MFVQVRAGGDTKTSDRRQSEVAGMVEAALGRFGEQLKTIDVFLSDENGRSKHGDADKRCLIETRLAGLPPIAVHADAATFDDAVAQCTEKMERTLDHRLGRLADKGGHVPASGA